MATRAPEETVWQGTPSALADLPLYLLLLVGGVAATIGLRILGAGVDAPATVGARDPRPIFTWLTVGAWVVCGIVALNVFVRSRSTRYHITTERLRITHGLLSTTTEELELRRVRDTSVLRPFLLRLLGLGHVFLVTADASTPRVVLRAVRGPQALQGTIRELVQGLYTRHGVREIDVM